MNNVQLIGRLTRDPELKSTSGGMSYCKFSLAVNRPFDRDKKADFINCVAWKETAENMAKYLGKGSQVGIVGTIQTGSYEKNGSKVYTTEVMANQIIFLDSRKSGESHEAAYQPYSQLPQSDPVRDYNTPRETKAVQEPSPFDYIKDDLPF